MFKGLQDLAQSKLQEAKASVNSAAAQAQERIGTAKAAKKLLDDGGESAQASILAKADCIRSASFDAELFSDIKVLAGCFEDVSGQMRQAKLLEQVAGISKVEDFEPLSELYSQRAHVLGEIIGMLEKPVDTFTMTPSERDAASIASQKALLRAGVESTKDAFRLWNADGTPNVSYRPVQKKDDPARRAGYPSQDAYCLITPQTSQPVLPTQLSQPSASNQQITESIAPSKPAEPSQPAKPEEEAHIASQSAECNPVQDDQPASQPAEPAQPAQPGKPEEETQTAGQPPELKPAQDDQTASQPAEPTQPGKPEEKDQTTSQSAEAGQSAKEVGTTGNMSL